MDSLYKGLDYITSYINAVPTASWVALGALLASIPAVIGIVNWVKKHHLKKTGEKLASEFIVLNVAFWGAVLTVADFVMTQGTTFAPFLPFFSTHWAQVSAGAIAVHAIATSLHQWWKDRKARKPITSSSFGTKSAEVTGGLSQVQPRQPEQPPANLLQL
jgi:hypothetical protein